jgi:hypothetical protein
VNTTTTQAHGLGVRPVMFDIYLECKTADLGYSIGHIIPMPTQHTSYAPNPVYNMRADATNVVLIMNSSSVHNIIRLDTRAPAAITAASWKMICIPYAIV